MKKLLAILSSLGILSCATFGASQPTDWQEETKLITQMGEALQKQTIEDFMDTKQVNRWTLQRIPSKWFVDTYATDEKERRYLQATRDFGYQLALRLDDLAKDQQTLPQDDALFQRTMLLCDMGEWFTKTAGYGNFFLAQRSIDLAAVGLGRLTASMDFPLNKCGDIATRMNQEWREMSYRVRVLNGEANTNIFISIKMDDEQLDDIWGIGCTLQSLAENTAWKEKWKESGWKLPTLPSAKIVNVGAFTNNLHFFVQHEYPERPHTLVRSWDCRQHRGVIFGGEDSRTLEKALSLVKYRSIVGFFPDPFVRSKEETKQLETEIAEAAKKGRKMAKPEDSPSYDPLKMAFHQEWKQRTAIAEENKYADAYQAYKEITDNRFFDDDTGELQMKKAQRPKE